MDVGGIAALAMVGGTGAALLVTALGFYLPYRRLRRDADAERAEMIAGPVMTGDDKIAVAGTVEVLDGGGKEVTGPFLLRLRSGPALRVEPAAPIQLTAGAQVFVRGVLRGPEATAAAPYRDTPWDGVIVAPPGGSVFASSTRTGSVWEGRAGEAADMAMLMLALFAVTELPYLGFWYEWARGDRPTIIFDLFFWFIIIDGSFIGGAVGSALQQNRPWFRS